MGNGGTPRFLMCEPGGYSVHHIMNPWMDWTEAVDVRRAAHQWETLANAIEMTGGQVEAIPNSSRSGAMTFTRDTAVVTAPGRAILLRNAGRRGDLEPEHIGEWLRRHHVTTDELEPDERIDGGNVVPTADGWLLGVPPGATIESVHGFARRLRDETGAAVHGVPIRDPKYGHLDTALADLCGRGWLAHPSALAQPDLTDASWEPVLRDRPVITVTDDEAAHLACNVIVVEGHVIGDLPARVVDEVARLGLEPVRVELDEFRKAGGGAHCLTLELDPVHQRRDLVDHNHGASATSTT